MLGVSYEVAAESLGAWLLCASEDSGATREGYCSHHIEVAAEMLYAWLLCVSEDSGVTRETIPPAPSPSISLFL